MLLSCVPSSHVNPIATTCIRQQRKRCRGACMFVVSPEQIWRRHRSPNGAIRQECFFVLAEPFADTPPAQDRRTGRSVCVHVRVSSFLVHSGIRKAAPKERKSVKTSGFAVSSMCRYVFVVVEIMRRFSVWGLRLGCFQSWCSLAAPPPRPPTHHLQVLATPASYRGITTVLVLIVIVCRTLRFVKPAQNDTAQMNNTSAPRRNVAQWTAAPLGTTSDRPRFCYSKPFCPSKVSPTPVIYQKYMRRSFSLCRACRTTSTQPWPKK